MDLAEAIKQAIQDEADDLGCSGAELPEFLSGMLDRIGTRINHLMGDESH